MNKRELVQAVTRETGLDEAAADSALTAITTTITKTLAEGEKVTLAGFGTFETRARAARQGRNPQTGEPLSIAANNAPAFKPAAALKRAILERMSE